MKVQDLVDGMPGAFLAEKAEGIDAAIVFHVTGDDPGDWTLTIKDKKCSVASGAIANPRLTLTASSQDFLDVFTGKLDGTRAFMQGKLKLAGDMSLAMKLAGLFKG